MPFYKEIDLDSQHRICLWQISESEQQLLDIARQVSLDTSFVRTMKSSVRRKEWLASRVMAIQSGIEFTDNHTVNSRPKALRHEISFSHSGGMAAVSFRKKGITGIDIQERTKKLQLIQDRFIHQNEKTAINNLTQLALIWSAKEAIYKVYSDPGIVFREDISVQLPSFIGGKGTMRTTIDRKGKHISHDLYFEVFENYVLVCVTE